MRYFICLLALTSLACRGTISRTRHIAPELEKLIPADTIFLAGADFDELRKTQVYQKYLGDTNLLQLNGFTRETGLDPRKDLSQAISASNGKTGIIAATGHFSGAEIERRLTTRGAPRTTYKGHTLFGDANVSAVVLHNSIAVAGPTAAVHAVIDGDGANQMPATLADLVRAIPVADQLWAAVVGGLGSFGNLVPPESNAGQVFGMFRGIETVRIGVDARNGLDAQAEAKCDNDADAKRVRDAIKGFVGFGRLSTPDNQPDLLKVFDAIHADQTGSKVDVQAQVGPELVNKFLDLWIGRSTGKRR